MAEMAVNMVTTFLQFGVLHFDRKCKCECPRCGRKLRIYKTKASFPLNEGCLIYTETYLVCLPCKLKSRGWDLNAVDLSPKEAFKRMASEMYPFDGKESFGAERWDNGSGEIKPKISNVPAYATECRFIVYYVHKGERLFYAASNDKERAQQYADNVLGGGYIYDKERRW